MESLISLAGITKRFGNHQVLRGIDLEIGPGVTGLLGPNGAGKSTLIKMLLGLVRASSGTGRILGHPMGHAGRLIRSRIGYVPEDDCYISGLSGVEVVRFSATLSGMHPVEALRRAHEILDFCNMKEDRYRTVDGYSTGMRQKVKFAAALVHDPDYLILDEPTSGLDPEERDSFLTRVRTLSTRNGKSVLISTHILPDVQAVCDRVVIMARGVVRLDESLESINRPSLGQMTAEVDGDRELFLERLRKHGLSADLSPTGAVGVQGRVDDVSGLIWQAAAEAGVTLHSLRPARNSLESVFLKSIEEQADASQ